MPIGTISQALKLIQSGTSVQSSYTYYLTPSMPANYASAPPTQYFTTPGGPTHYSYASGHFVNMTSATYSNFLTLITGRMEGLSNSSFSALGSFSADILISGLNVDMYLGTDPTLGFAYYPNSTSSPLDLDIVLTHLGLTTDWDVTLSHEIMHSLGLRDVGPAAGGGLYSGVENTGQYTMMAYNRQVPENRFVIELQLYDVAAFQALHGRDISYNATDTTINQFTETWGAATGQDRIFAIWDAAGKDTIDASGMSRAALIDLRPGYFSSIGPNSNFAVTAGTTPAVTNQGKLNISIAYGAYIEDAKGTAEADLIIGNLLSNTLEGGNGNDVIFGEGNGAIYDAGDGVDNYQQITTTGSHVEAAPATIQAYLDNKAKQQDHLLGGGGDDYLHGGRGADIIEGNAGNDYILGGGGFDEIWGGDRDNDQGVSDGTDKVSYAAVGAGISITYTGGEGGNPPNLGIVDGEGGVDNLHSIEEIIGTAHRDYFSYAGDIAAGYALTIDAGAGQTGNDIINANLSTAAAGLTIMVPQASGDSYLESNSTHGRIYLKNFHTQVIGSNYDDTITDEADGDKHIDGGGGDDVITVGGDAGDSTLQGGMGDDTITGGDGNDVIIGDTLLTYAEGANHLYGGDGADHIISTSYSDHIEGGDGDDFIEVRVGYGEGFYLRPGAGNDLIDATQWGSVDVVFGPDDGHDTILRPDADHVFSSQPNVILDGVAYSDVILVWGVTPDSMGFFSGYGDVALVVQSTGASVFVSRVWGHVSFTGGVSSDGAPNFLELGINGGPFYQYTHVGIHVVVGDPSVYNTAAADYAAATALPPGAGEGGPGDDDLSGGRGDDSLSGGDGNDSFSASGGNDTIDGGDGTDVLNLFGARTSFSITAENGGLTVVDLTGGEGTLTLTSVEKIFFATDNEEYEIGDLIGFNGTEGDDTLTGSDRDNQMSGLGGNDTVYGLGGNDLIDGGDGDDTLDGGAGYDTLDGGDGVDVALYAGASSGFVIFRDVFGTISVGDPAGDSGWDTLSDVESLYFAGDDVTIAVADLPALGTEGDDELTGSARADVLFGQDGDDQLDGLAGDDDLYGGDGDDIYLLGAGTDSASDDGGDDRYVYALGDGDDDIYDGAGIDRLEFGAGIAPGDIIVSAGEEDSYVLTFANAPGSIILWGAALEDYAIEAVYFAATGQTLTLADLIGIYGTPGADDLTGTAADDRIYGLAGNDLLKGLAGNDILDGGAGADTMQGGTGNDVYVVDQSGDVVTEAYNAGSDEVRTALASYTLGANVERLTGLAATGQTLTGNSLANILTGGAGADVLNGGSGSDTAAWSWSEAGVAVDLQNAILSGDAAGDTLISIENLTGGSGADTLSGTSAANVLDGGGGADLLTGRGGNDVYYVDNVGDSVVELAGQGSDEIRTTLAALTLADNVETLRYVGSGNFDGSGNGLGNILYGGAGNDTLHGGAGVDTLIGGDGADALYGGEDGDVLEGRAGADYMEGGAGSDVYTVDNAGDVVHENADEGIEQVYSTLVAYTLTANVENLQGNANIGQHLVGNDLANVILGGYNQDTIEGGSGNDELRGQYGNDVLIGGAGDDLLVGGDGIDELTGGAGADTFRYGGWDSGTLGTADRITDFVAGEDRIDLAGVDAGFWTPGQQHFAFIGSTAFSNTAGELRYSFDGTDTYVQADWDGDGAADIEIVLTGQIVLAAADFIL
jgi:Ca2+-binding RTX toxin-like protein